MGFEIFCDKYLMGYSEEPDVYDVIIPDGVETIEQQAFEECHNIRSVFIPEGVEIIRTSAFFSCKDLERVILPKSIKSIEKYAFAGCEKLKYINLPDNISVDGSAFLGCKGLADSQGFIIINNVLYNYCGRKRNITIPENVTKIENNAFINSPNIKNVKFHEGINSIGGNAFLGTEWLWSQKGEFVIVNDILICHRGFDTSVRIPEGVRVIGSRVFEKEWVLKNVIIPDSVKFIDEYAFIECSSLKKAVIPAGVEIIGIGAFYGCSKLEDVVLPEKIRYIGSFAFHNCDSLEEIIVPSGIKNILENTFEFCFNLKKVKIANGVKTIEKYAFCGCSELNEVIFPESLEYIGNDAFSYCEKLKGVKLPENIKYISEGAFLSCRDLTEIKVPEQLRLDLPKVFAYCEKLESVDIHKENMYYSSYDGVVYDKFGTRLLFCPQGKKDIMIRDGVKSIEEKAFQGCKFIKHINFPDSIENISDKAFFGCSSLENMPVFGYTIDGSNCQWFESNYDNIQNMLKYKAYSINLPVNLKFQFISQIYFRENQPEAEDYIKKNFSKVMRYFIDADDFESVKKLFECGKFISKRNIMTYLKYSIEHTQRNGDVQIQTYIMNYKNEHYGDIDPFRSLKL